MAGQGVGDQKQGENKKNERYGRKDHSAQAPAYLNLRKNIRILTVEV
jgi:hypothetical protein